MAGDNGNGREWLRFGAGGDIFIGRRLPGPELLVLELLLACGVVCMVVGGPEACLRLLLPWGGGVTWAGVGVTGIDFSVTLLEVVVESADETVTLAAISFCKTHQTIKIT